MDHLHIDLETKSAVDLRATGVYRYAEDPSTDVWIACFALNDEPVQRWFPGDPVPQLIVQRAGAHDTRFVAHNYTFERIMWREVLAKRYGWPQPVLSQWECTMAHGMGLALPRSLGELASVLGQPEQKDEEGHRLMLQMCRPRIIIRPDDPRYKKLRVHAIETAYKGAYSADTYSPAVTALDEHGPDPRVIVWWYTEEKLKRLAAYCDLDVDAERGAHKRLNRIRPMTETERKVFLVDARINDRGLKIDLPTVANARRVMDVALRGASNEMQALAGCGPTQVKALVEWLQSRGVDTDSVAKAEVEDLLSVPDLADDVRRVLEIRLDAGQSAHTKYAAMVERACRDGAIYGEHVYHAAHTGRFAGSGVQIQNMLRPTERYDLAYGLQAMIEGWSVDMVKIMLGDPFGLVGELTRNMIVARKGNVFRTADFANIEGRGNAWLAGSGLKLDAFRAFDRKEGPDLYLVAAAGIFRVPVDSLNKKSPERQTGKVAELACGYQGSIGAFRKMAKTYRLTFTDPEILKAVRGWREDDMNAPIVDSWFEMEATAFKAVENPGVAFSCCGGRLKFIVKGAFLWLQLPSKRLLAYARPAIEQVERELQERDDEGNLVYDEKNRPVMRKVSRPSVVYWNVDSKTRRWMKKPAYGGLWCENAVQALCRDILVEAMFRAEDAGYTIVLHAHDELVAEVPQYFGSTKEFEELMGQAPVWTPGLPVVAEGWSGPRYRK